MARLAPSMLRTVCFVLVALCAAACSRIERTRQCVTLVTTVNGALDEIAAREDAGAGGATAEREIAARYERLGNDLEALPVESPELAKTLAEYRELLADTVRQLRRAAAARDRNDRGTVAIAKRDLAAALRREKLLIMRIDNACQSP